MCCVSAEQTLDPTAASTAFPKLKALHGIKKSLEDYSSRLAQRMLREASDSVADEENFVEDEEETSTNASADSGSNVLRVRADLKETTAETANAPLSRHLRSAYPRYGGAKTSAAAPEPYSSVSHHRKRRKGCPPMHGKDQLLCPSRNTHRYDVCISQQQLCDHVRDCPDGEDESPSQCFFYKPLDAQLKTLSHAVLLLVDNVMGEQTPRTEL